ncbi:protection of telomeres protein 1a isoform X2 [Jatropha curcas]|uniref:protection of telomeres protein 1a isoform X2 n=1 Tax=Jatropha curcas TaxID=180498 RepID=UPI001893A5EC|nr:protection of telomeres protein 1a isoform X2 [Jatropha curcas]
MQLLPSTRKSASSAPFSSSVYLKKPEALMKIHHGEVNAVFNKAFSSFALYEGKDKDGPNFLPYQHSLKYHPPNFLPYQHSLKYHPRGRDSKFIAGLRKWFTDLCLDEGPTSFTFLREMKEGERAHLLCKVLHVSEVSKQVWMAFVWDGTDCPPINIDSKMENEMDCPLPLQMEPVPLPRDLLCMFPTTGSILRVIIDKGNDKHVLHLLSIGKWVKFLSILCEVHVGLWRGVLTPLTKLRYISDDNCLVLGCQRSYNERLSSELGRIPYWCFPWCSTLTEVDYDHAPFVSLMDALACSKVTAKFKCVVRVVAAFPWQPEDFCAHLKTYGIRLTLEDPTARIHAFLFGEDGEKFFDGYPSIDVLRGKRNTLLGVAANEDAPRSPPWIQCCLKSYYLDRSDPWGSRHFRIFGTKHVN